MKAVIKRFPQDSNWIADREKDNSSVFMYGVARKDNSSVFMYGVAQEESGEYIRLFITDTTYRVHHHRLALIINPPAVRR